MVDKITPEDIVLCTAQHSLIWLLTVADWVPQEAASEIATLPLQGYEGGLLGLRPAEGRARSRTGWRGEEVRCDRRAVLKIG